MSYRHPRRWHEIERALREEEAQAEADRAKFWHNVKVVKATILIGFVLYMVVPPQYKDWVALAGNTLWLLKT